MNKDVVIDEVKNKKSNKKKILVIILSLIVVLALIFIFLLKKDRVIIAMKINTNDVFDTIKGNVNSDIDGGIGFAIETLEDKNIVNVITKDKSLKEIYQTENDIDNIYYYKDFIIVIENEIEQYRNIEVYKKVDLKDFSSEELYRNENNGFIMYINDYYMFVQKRNIIKAIPFSKYKEEVTLNYNDIVYDIAKQKGIQCSYDNYWGTAKIDNNENAYFRTEKLIKGCSGEEFVVKVNLKTFNYEGVSKLPENEISVNSLREGEYIDSINGMVSLTGYNDNKNKVSIKDDKIGLEYVIDKKHNYTRARFLPDNYIELIYLLDTEYYSFKIVYYNIKEMKMETNYYNFDIGDPLDQNYRIYFITK